MGAQFTDPVSPRNCPGSRHTEKESNEHLPPTRFLMARAHAAWLVAVRLGMGGQVVESYPSSARSSLTPFVYPDFSQKCFRDPMVAAAEIWRGG
jgi:hypothetical protein